MIEKPAPRLLWSWMALLAMVTLPALVLTEWLVRSFFPEYIGIAAVVGGVCALILGGWYLPRRRDSLSFAMDGERVWVRSGVVFVTTRYIPVEAVRQVTLWQGPLERRWDTAFLLISATGGYLLVEGIPRERAEVWRKRLLAL